MLEKYNHLPLGFSEIALGAKQLRENQPFLTPAEIRSRAVVLFTQIRDMFFETVRYGRRMSYEEIIDDMRIRRRGACSAKHYLLGSEYEQIGVPTIYVTTPFLWQDLNVDYPPTIKRVAEKMPVQYHLSLGILIDNETISIDATWDPALKRVGFPVNNLRERITQAELAVIPCGEPVFHWNGDERFDYIKELKGSMSGVGVEPEFYERLNQWLRSLRSN